MKVLFEINAANGSYTDAEGNEKTRWVRMGKVFQRDNGKHCAVIESMPVGGDWNGWVELFPPREKEERQPTNASGGPSQEFDDSIPFA